MFDLFFQPGFSTDKVYMKAPTFTPGLIAGIVAEKWLRIW